MRVIEALNVPVRAIAVSPCGTYLAAFGDSKCAVLDLLTGSRLSEWDQEVLRILDPPRIQPVFVANQALMVARNSGLFRTELHQNRLHILATRRVAAGPFSGGLATSPDGKTLVATRTGQHQAVKLEQWDVFHWQEKPSFEFWSPFLKLAFSASGESLAGINFHCFELRYAHSGGLNKCVFSRQLQAGSARLRRAARSEPPNVLLSFPRRGERVVFGWDSELRVMETHAGNVLRWLESPGDPFVDVSFMGSGRLIATVDGTPLMRLWAEESCEIVHELDWGAGGLTCLAPTADGLAGVCGTADGRLVVFDVEE